MLSALMSACGREVAISERACRAVLQASASDDNCAPFGGELNFKFIYLN